MSEEDIERYIWTPHHTWAGEELYGMCIDLRGFYTKVTHSSQVTGTLVEVPPKDGWLHREDGATAAQRQVQVADLALQHAKAMHKELGQRPGMT